MDMSLSKLREMVVMDREDWHAVVYGVTERHDITTKQQQPMYLYILYKLYIYIYIYIYISEEAENESLSTDKG